MPNWKRTYAIWLSTCVRNSSNAGRFVRCADVGKIRATSEETPSSSRSKSGTAVLASAKTLR